MRGADILLWEDLGSARPYSQSSAAHFRRLNATSAHADKTYRLPVQRHICLPLPLASALFPHFLFLFASCFSVLIPCSPPKHQELGLERWLEGLDECLKESKFTSFFAI